MRESGTVYVNKNLKTPKRTASPKFDKLDKLAEASSKVVYELSSVFPFQLFPDKVIIDETKVTIIRKDLLFKREVPVAYEQLGSVRVNRGILFASLEFDVIRFSDPPSPITHLRPIQANKAKRYIMALMQLSRERVDLSRIEIKMLREKLEKIGATQEEVVNLF